MTSGEPVSIDYDATIANANQWQQHADNHRQMTDQHTQFMSHWVGHLGPLYQDVQDAYLTALIPAFHGTNHAHADNCEKYANKCITTATQIFPDADSSGASAIAGVTDGTPPAATPT